MIKIFYIVLINILIKIHNKRFKKQRPKKIFFTTIDLIKNFNLVFNLIIMYNQMHYMSSIFFFVTFLAFSNLAQNSNTDNDSVDQFKRKTKISPEFSILPPLSSESFK